MAPESFGSAHGTDVLRFTRLQAHQYRMPLKRPYGTARGVTKASTNFLVTVTAQVGGTTVHGAGECQPRHALTGDGDRRGRAAWSFLTAALQHLQGREVTVSSRAEALTGIRGIMADLARLAQEHADQTNREKPFRGTLLGIEVALLDAVAKSLALQISELLGKKRDEISISISTISSSTKLEDVADRVVKQTRFPMTRVKGVGDLDYDWRLMETVAGANQSAGRPKAIWMDINEALDFDKATTFVQGLVTRMANGTLPSSIVLEGILPKAEVTDLPRLQQQADDACRAAAAPGTELDLRIMPDEGMWDVSDLEQVNAHGGCRALNIKAPKAGGLLASLDLAEAAVAADPDIHVCIGGMLGTSDLTAFALHNLARALPRADYLTTVPPTNVEQRIAEPRARYQERGSNIIAAQSMLGLGTELDMTKVQPYIRQSLDVTADGVVATTAEQPAAPATPEWEPVPGANPAASTNVADRSYDTISASSTGTAPVLTVTPVAIAGDRTEKTLVFAGDTSLGDVHLQSKGGDLLNRLQNQPMSFFDQLRPLLADHDTFILNLETVLALSPTSPFEGQKRFLGWDTPERTLGVLNELGVNAVTLANNHTMDFGEAHLLDTKRRLEAAGISAIGAGASLAEAGAPLTMRLNFGGTERNVHVLAGLQIGRKLRDEYGFYAEDSKPGIYPMSIDDMSGTIQELRRTDPTSLIIVYPHWGQNYQWVKPTAQRASAEFTAAGANLVIGHGAHVLQQIGATDRHATVYSLGNFVFNWSGRFDQYDVPPYSLVARVGVALAGGQWQLNLRLYPIASDNRQTEFRPRPLQEAEFESLWASLLEADLDGSFAVNADPAQDELGYHIACTLTTGNNADAAAAPLPVKRRSRAATTSSATASSKTTATSPGTAPAAPSAAAPPGAADEPLPQDATAFSPGSTTRLLAQTVVDRGFAYEVLRVPSPSGVLRTAMKFTVKDHNYFIRNATVVKERQDGSPGSTIDGRAVQICKRKDVTSAILRAYDFSVPRGAAFAAGDLRAATLYFEGVVGGCPDGMCVKPASGNKGKQIYLNITDRQAFRSAFEAVAKEYDTILVEESVSGDVLRFLYIGGTVAAIRRGLPANVVGDGTASVAALVDAKNAALREQGADRHSRLRIGTAELELLGRSGITPESIPAAGERVFLSSLSNRHAAAEIIDCTDDVHPSYIDVVQRAAAQIPDLTVCGVDIMIKDFTVPAEAGNHYFIELNTTPGIRGHHAPTVGTPRDIAGMIIDHVAETLP